MSISFRFEFFVVEVPPTTEKTFFDLKHFGFHLKITI